MLSHLYPRRDPSPGLRCLTHQSIFLTDAKSIARHVPTVMLDLTSKLIIFQVTWTALALFTVLTTQNKPRNLDNSGAVWKQMYFYVLATPMNAMVSLAGSKIARIFTQCINLAFFLLRNKSFLHLAHVNCITTIGQTLSHPWYILKKKRNPLHVRINIAEQFNCITA